MTRLLLEAGGQVEDPPVPQYRGCPSPAMTAALHGEDTVLQHLLSSGAKSDKVTLSSTDLSLRGRENRSKIHTKTLQTTYDSWAWKGPIMAYKYHNDKA